MLPKPKHLNPQYAAQFSDDTVVAAYPTRPPYPAEVFSILLSLLPNEQKTVLELGCGTGDVTRRLAYDVHKIDAVDPSLAMLNKARALPHGMASNIRWFHQTAEDFDYAERYSLVMAAESLHWMQWDIIFPRIRMALSPQGVLAIILGRGSLSNAWDDELNNLIKQYSTNREYKPYDLLEELQLRKLFLPQHSVKTKPELFAQSVDDYIKSFHSRNGFSEQRMGDSAQDFDARLRSIVQPYSQNGILNLEIVADVVWGLPTQE